MKEQLKWTEAFQKWFNIVSLALGHGWTLLLKIMVSLIKHKKQTKQNEKHWLFNQSLFNAVPCNVFFSFLGYLYFSEGSRQTEYNFNLRQVNRVLLNYGWLDCY